MAMQQESLQLCRNGEQALAYSRFYELCRQLYLDGLTTETLPTVMALPDLAMHLPTVVDADEGRSEMPALDEIAAAHQALFGFHLFPFESIFLESSGLLGSVQSEQVSATYHAVGYLSTQRGGAPDHLGEEFGLLAHLCAAEAEAWIDKRVAIAQRMQREQVQFLQRHLLRWLAPCAVAICRHDNHFFTELTNIAVDLIANHFAVVTFGSSTVDRWKLPSTRAILDDPQTTLKDIAEFLITPVHSGVFLSRFLINRIGREQRLPRGFGSRIQMVTNLLRTAAQYEALPGLLDSLTVELSGWQQVYQTMSESHPGLAMFVEPWLARTTETIAVVQMIDAAIGPEDAD